MTDAGWAVSHAGSNPFRLGVSPEEAIRHRAWQEAGDVALSLMIAGPCTIVLTGESGTGKTLLLSYLRQRLRASGYPAQLVPRGDRIADCDGSGLPPGGVDARFVLIDDARSGGGAVPRLPATDGLRCVMAMLPAAETAGAGLAYPYAIVRLTPLPPDEARAFVAARLAQAGRPDDLLSHDALALLVEAAAGIPRKLCSIGGGALHLATLDGAPQVTYEHVAEAMEMTGLADTHAPAPAPEAAPEPAPIPIRAPVMAPAAPRPRRRAAALAGLVALVAVIGAVMIWRTERHPPATQVAMQAAPAAMAAQPAAETEPTTDASPASDAPSTPDASPTPDAPPPQTAPAAPAPAASAPATLPAVTPAASVAPAPSATEQTAPQTAQPNPPDSPVNVVAPAAVVAGPAPASADPGAAPGQSGAAKMAADSFMPPTPTHLVVSFPFGDRSAEQQGDILAQHLRQAGYLVGDPVPALRLPATAGLHAFFTEDLATAQRLHAELGPSAPQASLAALRPRSSLPRPGTLEITVPANTPVDEWTQALDRAGLEPQGDPAASTDADPPSTAIAPTTPADGSSAAPDQARTVRLAWTDSEPPEPHRPVRYFVELRALDGGDAREVFAAYADQPSVSVTLGAASHNYAWRVYAVHGAGGHYDGSRWFRFSAGASSVAQK